MKVHRVSKFQIELYNSYQNAIKCTHQNIDSMDGIDDDCRNLLQNFETLFKLNQQNDSFVKCGPFDELV